MLLDLPATATAEEQLARLAELHEAYRADYQAYYDRNATADSPAIRGADPLIVLVPGVGMFSYGANKQTARVAGEFYVNAINVMRGAEALSTYAPIDEAEKFRIEYWALEEAKLQRLPKPKSHDTRIALVTGAASGIGKAIATRLAAEGACVVIADLDLQKAQAAAAELGNTDVAIGVVANVTDEAAVQFAIDETVLAFGGVDLVVNNAGLSLSKPLLETTVKDWDLQHDVMAKGSFLVSKAAGPRAHRSADGRRRHLHLEQELRLRGPEQHRVLRHEGRPGAPGAAARGSSSASTGVKVNGINPDGRSCAAPASSPQAGERTAPRPTGSTRTTSASSTRSARSSSARCCPENVANAVAVLTGPDLSHTTGLHIPVDAGVAAAFLR